MKTYKQGKQVKNITLNELKKNYPECYEFYLRCKMKYGHTSYKSFQKEFGNFFFFKPNK